METKQIMEHAEEALLHTYNRYPVVLERGEGVYLYDTNGKQYLDFAAGIAVSSLGYCNEEYNNALKEQIDHLLHTSNLYYSKPAMDAAEKLKKASGMDRIFFTNSGTEAIEGAIKAARKYAYAKQTGRYEIIAMKHSFHGRSMGALSVTGTESYQIPFRPLVDGVVFAEYNNLESVKEKFSEKTCAVIMETVQGEGGIYPAQADFLKGVKSLCEEHGALLILDEIQCGMGRTGAMFAWQSSGVKPDIMAAAKALGCGVPVGAFCMTEETAVYSLCPGDHGTTYGGNPLVCTAVSKVLELYEKLDIVSNVKEVSGYFEHCLNELVSECDLFLERRGTGLLQGIAVKEEVPAGTIVNQAMEQGLLIITAGGNVLRFVPPLIITKEHVDEMMQKLRASLGALKLF